MNHLAELTEIIQKAVPEVMELKFGCKIQYKIQLGRIIDTDEQTHIRIEFMGYIKHVTKAMIEYDTTIKILGRDIQLADVLRAIGEYYLVTGSGEFAKNVSSDVRKGAFEYCNTPPWNLGKSLHEQSEETISFLWSILCKNNQ